MITLLTDRTTEEVRWNCEMEWWWYKHAEGGGIVPSKEAPYFLDGRMFHEDLAMFAKGMSLEEVLLALPTLESCEHDQIKLETLSRRIGWLVAFYNYIFIPLMKRYDIVKVEEELIVQRVQGMYRLWIGVIPDLVLREKKTGKLIYLEYKTTSTMQPKFAHHWPHAIQIHLGLRAIEDELGEKVDYGQVLGFYKGYDRAGKLRHPYTWAYFKDGTYRPDYMAGWDLAPVWEYPKGVAEWAVECGEEIYASNFNWSAPVYLDERKLENMLLQTVQSKVRLEGIVELLKSDPSLDPMHYLEQRTIHCRPIWGDACPYLEACENATVGKFPIQSGLYQKRTPHHELEIIGVEE